MKFGALKAAKNAEEAELHNRKANNMNRALFNVLPIVWRK